MLLKTLPQLCLCVLIAACSTPQVEGQKKTSLSVDANAQLGQKTEQPAKTADDGMQLKFDTRLKPLKPLIKQAAASGVDMERLRRQAREEATIAAQISREYSAYQVFPRKAFMGARAKQPSVALWADAWMQKIERVGTDAYPKDAHGNKLRGQLRVTVEINKDGSLLNAQVDRTSGKPELDQAALRIVQLATPFARLPADLVDEDGKPATVLVIVRTWIFGPNNETRGQPESSQGPENAHSRH